MIEKRRGEMKAERGGEKERERERERR